MASSLEFRILGPLEVTRDGKPISIAAPRRRTLLGLLLLRANEPVSLELLIEELWSGRPPRAAKASVHNQVAALRKVLGPDVIETYPSGYRISVDSQRLDLARFEALVAEARSAEWGARATKLREALAEWRGPPLADVPCDGLQTETVRLEELRLAALEERIESELALGLNAELGARARVARRAAPSSRAALGSLDGRAVSLRPTGGRPGDVPAGSRDSRSGARTRAVAGAQETPAGDPRPGSAARRAGRRGPRRAARTDRSHSSRCPTNEAAPERSTSMAVRSGCWENADARKRRTRRRHRWRRQPATAG